MKWTRLRGLRSWPLAGALTLALCALPISDADAQAKKAPKAAAQSDEGGEENALKSYDTGVRAWQSGKADAAVQQLSIAIGASKLPPQQMAKALYYRGLAQRKLGKPALAISDLQSALWLKGGLSDAERAEATAARTAAYSEAGIADPQAGKASQSAAAIGTAPPVPKVASAAPARPAEPAKEAAPPPVPRERYSTAESADSGIWRAPVALAPGSSGAAAPTSIPQAAAATAKAPAQVATPASPPVKDWSTRTAVAPVPAPPPAVAAPEARLPPATAVPATVTVSAPAPARTAALPSTAAVAKPPASTASIGTAYVQAPAPAPVPAPAVATPRAEPAVAKPSSGSGPTLSGVFSVFNSDMPTPPAMPERRVPPPPRVDEDPDAGKAPDWSMTGAPVPGSDRTKGALPKVQYRLQVGSAATKQDAERIAARLKAEQSKALAKHAVDVDQSGGSKPVWRVRIGPYVTANEPRNLCVKLRQSGYDCLVVMQ